MRRTVVTLAVMSFVASAAWTPSSAATTQIKDGRFWLQCASSHRVADDPIVWPGQPGATHSHDFVGNTTTDAYSTYANMSGQTTTCALPEDTAGYWFPTLLLDGDPVRVTGVNAYYWGFRGLTQPLPPDLRMLGGVSAGVSPGTGASARKLGWMCAKGQPVHASPPDCGTEFVRMIVTFPSCWDGVHTDSADHHSHMAYPSAGACPASHPVPVPRLVLHVVYDLHDATDAELSSDVMAGAPAGSTIHADFWNTWDQPTLVRLVHTCIDTGPNCVFRDS
jgi:Domain of unknown function (DUF1996)